jgi:hypothetical protein
MAVSPRTCSASKRLSCELSRSGAKAPRRSGEAFEVLQAEIVELEQVPQQFSRALGDHDVVGFGNRLQPCGEVRRVTYDAALLRFSRAQEVAHDHDPGRDPHANV